MPHIHSNRRKPAVVSALVLLLACLTLAACGSSSKSSSTSTNASATTPAGTGATGAGATGQGTSARGASRFKALRECLQKNGIALPARTPGRPGGPGVFPGAGAGGPQLPKGVTRAQYEAALKKCGDGFFANRRGGAARLKNPAYLTALTKFAACMRENGVNVPAPNTSGNGPVFDTKGIDTSSSQFHAAEIKCSTDLRSTFRRGAGASPGAAPRGESPAG
jgi:hypothetical protein